MRNLFCFSLLTLYCITITASFCFGANDNAILAKQWETRGDWDAAGRSWAYATKETNNLNKSAFYFGESAKCFLKIERVNTATIMMSNIKMDASDKGKKAFAKLIPKLEEVSWRVAQKGEIDEALSGLEFIANEQPKKRQKLADTAIKKGFPQIAAKLLNKDKDNIENDDGSNIEEK